MLNTKFLLSPSVVDGNHGFDCFDVVNYQSKF